MNPILVGSGATNTNNSRATSSTSIGVGGGGKMSKPKDHPYQLVPIPTHPFISPPSPAAAATPSNASLPMSPSASTSSSLRVPIMSRSNSTTHSNSGTRPSSSASGSTAAGTHAMTPNSPRSMNTIVRSGKDVTRGSGSGAKNVSVIAKAARESNLNSSLTAYLQNQLSLLSKRGHAREVLKMLEMREGDLSQAQDEKQVMGLMSQSAQQTPIYEGFMTEHQQQQLTQQQKRGSLSNTNGPSEELLRRALQNHMDTSSVFTKSGKRLPVSQSVDITSLLEVQRQQQQQQEYYFPTGSSNPHLPALPLARLNLPSQHYHANQRGPPRDSIKEKADEQYAILAEQRNYTRMREEKEELALSRPSHSQSSQRRPLTSARSWDPPFLGRGLEEDGRDGYGRRMLNGLATPDEKQQRWETLAYTKGDPVPNALPIKALMNKYSNLDPRDYRPYVSGSVITGAEKNSVLDYSLLRLREKGRWAKMLALAREDVDSKEKKHGTPPTGSQSARTFGRHTTSAPSSSYFSNGGGIAPNPALLPEPPSQISLVNPPLPSRSFHRNLHALAYRLNNTIDASVSVAEEKSRHGSSSSRESRPRHKTSASMMDTRQRRPSPLTTIASRHGLPAPPYPLPVQPLLSNIYSTAGFVASDFYGDEDDADQRPSTGAYGSFSATGGFSRPLHSRGYSTADPSLASMNDADQQEALQQWKKSLQLDASIEPPTTLPHAHPSVFKDVDETSQVPQDQSLQALLDFSDRNGSTPLFHSAWEGFNPIVALLCEYGANVNIRNVRRHTAMDMAVERSHVDVVRILLRFGSDGTYCEAKAARQRCHARLGQTYANWLKRMKAGKFLPSGAGTGASGNMDTPEPMHRSLSSAAAALPTDPETQYYLPLLIQLQTTDREILRHFHHTIFHPPPVTMDSNSNDFTDPNRSILKNLTREARLARRKKLQQEREELLKFKQKYLAAQAKNNANHTHPIENRIHSPSTPPPPIETDEDIHRWDLDRSVIGHLTWIRESRRGVHSVEQTPNPNEIREEDSEENLDDYEADLTSIQQEIQRQKQFYEEQASLIRKKRVQKESQYTPFEAWVDELELTQAVLTGNLSTVESILIAHPEHSALRIHGCSLLYHASYHGYYSIARALLAASVEHRLDRGLEAAAARAVEIVSAENAGLQSDLDSFSDPHHPFYDPDHNHDGTEKLPHEKFAYFYSHRLEDEMDVSASGWSATAPQTLDVNFLCVDRLKTTEEMNTDALIRKQMESRAQNRALRRRLHEKREYARKMKEAEKERKKELGLSDSDSSEDEEEREKKIETKDADESDEKSKFKLVPVPGTDASAPTSPTLKPVHHRKLLRSKSGRLAQEQREAHQRELDELIDVPEGRPPNPLQFQLWHQWIVSPHQWNKMIKKRQEDEARRRERKARGDGSTDEQGSNSDMNDPDADDPDEDIAELCLQRLLDAHDAEDSRFDQKEIRYETAIYIAIKRKHYRLALLLQNFGAISPYTQADLLMLCDIQLRARKLMAAIRCANYTAIASSLQAAIQFPNQGGTSLLTQLLNYQDTNGSNPILLSIQKNDLKIMELLKHATLGFGIFSQGPNSSSSSTRNETAFGKMLSSIKDRLGYSAIELSLLNASTPNATGPAATVKEASAVITNSGAQDMTSYLLTQGGLTLKTQSVLDLILSKQNEDSGALHWSVSYEGIDKLRQILLNSVSASHGSLSHLPKSEIINFQDLFNVLQANSFNLKSEHLSELLELVHGVQDAYQQVKHAASVAAAAGRGNKSKSRSLTTRQGDGFHFSTDHEMEVVEEEGLEASDSTGNLLPFNSINLLSNHELDEEELERENATLVRELERVEEEEEAELASKQQHEMDVEKLRAKLLADEDSDDETKQVDENGETHHTRTDGDDKDSDTQSLTGSEFDALIITSNNKAPRKKSPVDDGSDDDDEAIDAESSDTVDPITGVKLTSPKMRPSAAPFSVPASALGVTKITPKKDGTIAPVIEVQSTPAHVNQPPPPPPPVLPDLLTSELKVRLVWMLDEIETYDIVELLQHAVSHPPVPPIAPHPPAQTPSAPSVTFTFPIAPSPRNQDAATSNYRRQSSNMKRMSNRSDQGQSTATTPRRLGHSRTGSTLTSQPNSLPTSVPTTPPNIKQSTPDLTLLSWDNILKINPHIFQLCGVDFPFDQSRPISLEDMNSSSTTGSVAPSTAVSRRGSLTDMKPIVPPTGFSRSRRNSIEGSYGTESLLILPTPQKRPVSRPPSSSDESDRPLPSNPRRPVKKTGVTVSPPKQVVSSRPLLPHEIPDPPYRTITLASWFESFQRLAREGGLKVVRDLLDEFDRVTRFAREEQRRIAQLKVHAEQDRLAAIAADEIRRAQSRERSRQMNHNSLGVVIPGHREAQDQPLVTGVVDLSDVDTREAGLGVTDFSNGQTPKTPADYVSAPVASSIFTFVPHLDPVLVPPTLPLTESAAAAGLRALDLDMTPDTSGPSTTTSRPKKSVRWRGSREGSLDDTPHNYLNPLVPSDSADSLFSASPTASSTAPPTTLRDQLLAQLELKAHELMQRSDGAERIPSEPVDR